MISCRYPARRESGEFGGSTHQRHGLFHRSMKKMEEGEKVEGEGNAENPGNEQGLNKSPLKKQKHRQRQPTVGAEVHDSIISVSMDPQRSFLSVTKNRRWRGF